MPRYVERTGSILECDVSLATLDPITGILSVQLNEARASETHALVTSVSSPVPRIEMYLSPVQTSYFLVLDTIPVPFQGFECRVRWGGTAGLIFQRFRLTADQTIEHVTSEHRRSLGGPIIPFGRDSRIQPPRTPVPKPGETNFRVQLFAPPGSGWGLGQVLFHWRAGDLFRNITPAQIITTRPLHVPNGLKYMGNGILEWNTAEADWYELQVSGPATGNPAVRHWEGFVSPRPVRTRGDPGLTGTTRDTTPDGIARARLPRITPGDIVRVRSSSGLRPTRGTVLLSNYTPTVTIPATEPDIPDVSVVPTDPPEFRTGVVQSVNRVTPTPISRGVSVRRNSSTSWTLKAAQYNTGRSLPPGATMIQFAWQIEVNLIAYNNSVQVTSYRLFYPNARVQGQTYYTRAGFQILPAQPVANFVRSGGIDKEYDFYTFNPQGFFLRGRFIDTNQSASALISQNAVTIFNSYSAPTIRKFNSIYEDVQIRCRARTMNSAGIWSPWGWGSSETPGVGILFPNYPSAPSLTHVDTVTNLGLGRFLTFRSTDYTAANIGALPGTDPYPYDTLYNGPITEWPPQ